jgi:hypothetical protein
VANPRLDAYDLLCLGKIAKFGWVIQGVLPRQGDKDIPFAYTVGLTEAGLPELVISGLPVGTAQSILNTAARQSLETSLRPGQALTDVASVPLRVIDAPFAEVNMARRLYPGKDVQALQLVWPDSAGAYPAEPGWSLRDAQPIYAPVPQHSRPQATGVDDVHNAICTGPDVPAGFTCTHPSHPNSAPDAGGKS